MSPQSTRRAAATRVYIEQEIESAVRQLKIDGVTLEDCEAELHLLADFVRAQADGLRAAWPELMKGTVSELNQQGRTLGDVISEGLVAERNSRHSLESDEGGRDRTHCQPKKGDQE